MNTQPWVLAGMSVAWRNLALALETAEMEAQSGVEKRSISSEQEPPNEH